MSALHETPLLKSNPKTEKEQAAPVDAIRTQRVGRFELHRAINFLLTVASALTLLYQIGMDPEVYASTRQMVNTVIQVGASDLDTLTEPTQPTLAELMENVTVDYTNVEEDVALDRAIFGKNDQDEVVEIANGDVVQVGTDVVAPISQLSNNASDLNPVYKVLNLRITGITGNRYPLTLSNGTKMYYNFPVTIDGFDPQNPSILYHVDAADILSRQLEENK